jgi:hypothetical protein
VSLSCGIWVHMHQYVYVGGITINKNTHTYTHIHTHIYIYNKQRTSNTPRARPPPPPTAQTAPPAASAPLARCAGAADGPAGGRRGVLVKMRRGGARCSGRGGRLCVYFCRDVLVSFWLGQEIIYIYTYSITQNHRSTHHKTLSNGQTPRRRARRGRGPCASQSPLNPALGVGG